MGILCGTSKEILNLVDVLGLPKNIKSFEIKCSVDSLLTVKCEYIPENLDLDKDGKLITFLKEYVLVDKNDFVGKEDGSDF